MQVMAVLLPVSCRLPISFSRSQQFFFFKLFFLIKTGVCALNGKLYIVGGSDPYGQKGLKNCDVFDPVTKSWMNCAPLNIRKFALYLKADLLLCCLLRYAYF